MQPCHCFDMNGVCGIDHVSTGSHKSFQKSEKIKTFMVVVGFVMFG